MRIAIDMDEVLSDTHTAKAALFAARGHRWSDEELSGSKLTDIAPPEAAADVEREMQMGGFFANIEPMPGAAEALEEIVREHEVFIATAAMEYPASCPHKIAWMARHFPMVPLMNLVLCGNKSVIRADVLIDDSPRHFDGFEGIGVCFSALHNRGQACDYRLEAWADAPDLMARIARERGL
jgi:5'(3')-deoxyribonucleotidase